VADGCGGMADGGEAARLAVQALRDEVAEAERLRGAILDAIDRATKRVLALGSGAATTLAAVEIDGDMVRPYHVGDSQVLLVGQRGRIKILTTSHSPVGYALEAGLLSEEEALHHEERHLVSNVVGTPDMHVEMGPRCRMAPRDTLLVGSDGLFDNLLLEEIVELIRRGPLPVVAQRLVETASARMRVPHEDEPSKPDDLTFVVYRRR